MRHVARQALDGTHRALQSNRHERLSCWGDVGIVSSVTLWFQTSIPRAASQGQPGPLTLSGDDPSLLAMPAVYLRLVPNRSWRSAACSFPTHVLGYAAPPRSHSFSATRYRAAPVWA